MNMQRSFPGNSIKDTTWPVAVFAHNEAGKIKACLDSIYNAEPGRRYRVFVMANGCTDNTEEIVREYAGKHSEVTLVSIEMGDKCNAWNVFVHEIVPKHVPDSEVYFFMDGDCRACGGAFSGLASGLSENEFANAAGALPAGGRDKWKNRREMLKHHNFSGNLYALKCRLLRQIREKDMRLPIGLEGDDGVLGWLIKCDLDLRGKWDDNKVISCSKAEFRFEPVSLLDPKKLKTYWRRLIRYGRRRYEYDLLRSMAEKEARGWLPRHISETYPDIGRLKLRRDGIYTITNFIALKQLQERGERNKS